MTAVGKTLDLSLERTGSGGHALELKGGNHIRMFAIAEFCQGRGIDLAKPGRKDHRPDMERPLFRLLLEVDGVTLTDRHTDLAGAMLHIETGVGIDIIGGGHCLGIIDMDGPGDGQPLVIRVHMVAWAVLGTEPAGGTGIGIDIARPQIQPGGEISWSSFQCQQIGIGEHFNIGRPTGLDQFWRQDSE